MSALKRLRPSPALVVASIALLVAAAGTGYAASSLPVNSVGTLQLKNAAVTSAKIATDAVTSAKVKNQSLLAADFKAGQIPAGPPGPQGNPGPQGVAGAAGPPGAAGPSAKWALIGKDGNVVASSGGVTVVQGFPGGYYVNFGASVSGKAILVTAAFRDADSGFKGSWNAAICGGGTDGATCTINNNSSTVYVGMFNSSNTATENHAFYIAVIG